jgi:serine/threonine-protein kinase
MRYLPVLNEALAALDLVDGAMDETGCRIAAEHAGPDSAYIVRQQLGGGAFGEVFRAYDTGRGREVAIKRLRLEQLYDPTQRRRLLASARRELEAASRLRHPGIVRVLALGTEPDGTTYVVQEFVAGRSLRSMVPLDNSADVLGVLTHLQQIALALSALHEAGIVHRDLKPDNVLVRPDGSPVLVDFGIASVAGVRTEFDEKIAGTVPYMPPEQISGKRVDARTDVYALGVMAYEWLAGTRPLDPQGATWQVLAREVNDRKPLPISDFRPLLDPRFSILIGQMLEKNPRRRPQTALEVANRCGMLAEIYRAETTSASEK